MDSDGSNYNVAIGYNAGNDITTGQYNISIGGLSGCSSAAANNLTSDGNISIGYECGEVLEGTAAGNTLIGHQTADVLTTGQYNVVVGRNAMGAAQDVDNCSVVGVNALASLNHINGDGSIAIGKNTLNSWNPSSGSANQGQMTSIGYHSLENAVDGATQNTALGYYALNNLTTASANVAIGNQVLKSITTNGSNVGIGHAAGQNVVCGSGSDGGTHNTIIGNSAGQYCGEGLGNTFIGSTSGLGNSGAHLSGDYNTALGYAAGKALEGAATNNTLLGHNAGDTLTTGSTNTAIGKATLAAATTSDYCVAIGAYAGNDINSTDANGTVAVGYNALSQNTSGTENTALGYQALKDNVDGDRNTAIGYKALLDMTGGSGGNTMVGWIAVEEITTGAYNTGVGYGVVGGAGTSALTGSGNTAVGYAAGYKLEGNGYGNTFMGKNCGYNTAAGHSNVAIGQTALFTAGTTNDIDKVIAIGTEALYTSDDAHVDGSIAIGYRALKFNTVGRYNVAIGMDALYTNVDGDGNTAVGYQSLQTFEADTDGHGRNTGLGTASGKYISTGTGNTALGANALEGVSGTEITGDNNTAVGYQAGVLVRGATSGNTLIGALSGDAITTGEHNTALGYQALSANETSDNNLAVGKEAGKLCTGQQNTFLGSIAGNGVTSGTNNIAIGYGSDAVATGSYQSAIGVSAVAAQDYETRIGYQGGIQFLSRTSAANVSDGEDNKVAQTSYLFKIPAFAIIKSISLCITELSSNGTAKFCIRRSVDNAAADDEHLSDNGSNIEILGAGATGTVNTASENSGGVADIDAGSGTSNTKQVWYNDSVAHLNDLGAATAGALNTSDTYLWLCNAGTGNGDGNPSTTPKFRITVEFYGEN